jgi:hypothetical protein
MRGSNIQVMKTGFNYRAMDDKPEGKDVMKKLDLTYQQRNRCCPIFSDKINKNRK